MTARYLIGDVLERLAELPDASVDLVLTSSPFLNLRSYLPATHPDKDAEVGLEDTPGAFIDSLLDIVEELRRVLAPHGSLAWELGDTYSGSGGAGGDYNEGGLRDGQPKFKARWKGDSWPLPKSLCLIPELFRISLVYGANPLTGRATPRWRARNVVRWCRPNPAVGRLADKVRPATSDILIACTNRRYFDLDAIREPHKDAVAALLPHPRSASRSSYPGGGGDVDAADDDREYSGHRGNVAGAPPLDHWWEDEEWRDDVFDQDAWLVATQPYRGAHYAVWPEALLLKPILAMCPQRVCTICGRPSERISEPTPASAARLGRTINPKIEGEPRRLVGRPGRHNWITAETTTIGWTDCACAGGGARWRPGLVLDPFAGSGTTLAVAQGLGRDAIGIDIDERNLDLARERVGMFLEVDDVPGRRIETVATGGIL